MGQKVHPVVFRLGSNGVKDWSSKWFAAGRNFADTLLADIKIRNYLQSEYSQNAGLSRIEIARPARNARITIFCSRPGVVLGRKGEELDKLRAKLAAILNVPVFLTIEEIRKPELDARLVAENIGQQLVKRIAFRRAMKRAMASAMRSGAKGIKIMASGRLGGAEIARTEWMREGRVPLHTLRADIDYAESQAKTTYGIIGIKVWIFKGEVIGIKAQTETAASAE